ncbi:MAG: preprotein translocase subunit YajC [Corynebacterium sp.]|nr:preprotein translocase subunit YajC [Corynebacterium sp.]
MNSSYILIIGVIFIAVMFFQMRRQQARYKEIQKAQSTVGAGDKIVLTCGLHGEVTDADEKTVVVEIAAGVYTRWDRQAIMTVQEKAEAAAVAPASETEAPVEETETEYTEPVENERREEERD